MNMCSKNTSHIITPHGLTRAINITRGVRQGCPLSPTLFILFLNPLLQKLEANAKGYRLEETSLPGVAFAYDIVLTSSTHKNLQHQFNTCALFFEHFALEMALDRRDKTVYTHSSPTHKPLKHPFLGTEVPYTRDADSYKYLGVHVNLRMDWEKQT